MVTLPSSYLEGPSTASNELELPLFDNYAATHCHNVNEAQFATLDAVSTILVQEHTAQMVVMNLASLSTSMQNT